jgi:membrane protein
MANLSINVKDFWTMFKDTFRQWNEREPFNNSIIIAYYTIFSLPGLLVIIINVAGYFFEKESVTKNVTTQIQGVVGGDSAKDVEEILTNTQSEDDKAISLASILSVATLLFGATGVFYQLQQILNKMWEVKPKPKQKILKLLKDRVFSFGLILVVGFLLLVSLVLSAALTAVSDWVGSHVSESLNVVFKILDILVSFGVVTLLFAAIYKFLPDAKIKWRDVWMGAIVTAVLFVIAKFLLGLYFGNSDPGSAYGAAGTIILIMLWVSYAGLILLFGAEFTQVYATKHGRKIVPAEGAESTGGQGDNGAIVNKKTESQSKSKAQAKSADDRGSVRREEKSKGEKKLSFSKFVLYLVITRIRKAFF